MASSAVRALDEQLKPRGFERKALTWNRRSGGFADVIDVQISKSGDAMTINVGVIDPEVYRLCWGHSPSPFVGEPECTVRSRLGELVSGNDRWWQLHDPQTPNAVVDAIGAAFPFLERMHSRDEMARFLLRQDVEKRKYPPSIMYLAILNHDLGNQMAACSMLERLAGTALGTAWPGRVAELRVRLGCR